MNPIKSERNNASGNHQMNNLGNMKLILAAIAALVLIIVVVMVARNRTSTPAENVSSDQQKSQPVGQATYAPVTELKIEDMVVGTGAEAVAGKSVDVHYTGWLTNGTKFDSSLDRGQPFSFPLGAGRVIQGWDKGVAGMKVGGKRRLIIPPQMGYGEQGAPPVIPGGATLVFEVELLGVK